jgi:geranylgeranyl diphosphate synthase type I
MTIDAFRTWFQPYLAQTTHNFIAQAKLVPDRDLQLIIEHTEKLILANGKRIRPYLCRVMYNSKSENAVLIYLAFELFHTFCLIHDDVIDHGHLRHGEPTLHEFFKNMAKEQKREGEIAHIAQAQAILVGDLLINFVFSLVNQYDRANARRVKELFYAMANRVVLGQMCDVDGTTRTKASKRFIETKMQLKTAEYTFIFPLRIGYALTNEKNPAIDSFCQLFGTDLGQAFQIQDDLLDILPGDNAQKSSFSDIREGQHTLLTYYVFQSGSPDQKKTLRHYWRSNAINESALLTIFYDSGAIDYAKRRIKTHIDQAKEQLSRVKLPSETINELNDLVTYIANRSL